MVAKYCELITGNRNKLLPYAKICGKKNVVPWK